MRLRPARADDDRLLDLLDVTVAAEALQASPDPADPLIDLQVRARRTDRAARWPTAPREVVEVDGEPVGATLRGEEPGGVRLVDLHLLPDARGRGTGTAVVLELVRRADARGLALRARTRPDNVAMLAVLARAGLAPTSADPTGVELERPAR